MRGVLAQEIHHRVKNNLQTVASLLRLQARSDNVDARRALDDSVNRILAIAAVHEVLTEQREDDIDLGELLDRLRAMIVQGLGSGRRSRPSSGMSRWPGTARPPSRSSSPSSSRTRWSTAARTVRIELARQDGAVLAGDCGRRRGASRETDRDRAVDRACAGQRRARRELALRSEAGSAPRSCSRHELVSLRRDRADGPRPKGRAALTTRALGARLVDAAAGSRSVRRTSPAARDPSAPSRAPRRRAEPRSELRRSGGARPLRPGPEATISSARRAWRRGRRARARAGRRDRRPGVSTYSGRSGWPWPVLRATRPSSTRASQRATQRLAAHPSVR